MDRDKIFDLFEEDDDNSQRSSISTKDINDFKNSPIGRIGMFTKIISNHKVFHEKLEKFLKKEDSEVEVTNISKISTPTIYNRAWFYIKGIDLDNPLHIEAINTFLPSKLMVSLNSSISFFEGLEEYEKCAFLLKLKRKIDLS